MKPSSTKPDQRIDLSKIRGGNRQGMRPAKIEGTGGGKHERVNVKWEDYLKGKSK